MVGQNKAPHQKTQPSHGGQHANLVIIAQLAARVKDFVNLEHTTQKRRHLLVITALKVISVEVRHHFLW